MQERVTQQDLLNMLPGEKKTFNLPTELARHSAKSTASQTSKLRPRKDVEKYSCEGTGRAADGSFPLTITAIPKK